MKSIKNRAGFTLIETAIVLSIVAVVIAGIWLAMSGISQRARETRLISQVTQIMANTRQVMGKSAEMPNTTGYAQVTTAAISAGIFPADMVVDANNSINAMRGGAFIDIVTGQPVARLLLGRMNTEACTSLATKFIASRASRREYGITAFNVFATGNGTNIIPDRDMTAAEIITACNLANAPAAGFNITIDFTIM